MCPTIKPWNHFNTYLYISPVLEILITKVIPIISITLIEHSIASNILNVSAIWVINDTILESAIGSHKAAVRWYIIVIIASFNIGVIHIAITTITPTIPIAFFKIAEHPITVSTASPSTLPTTGIKLETAALAVLAVIPSTLLP